MKLKTLLLSTTTLVCVLQSLSQDPKLDKDHHNKYYYWTVTKDIRSKKVDSDSAYIKGLTTEYSKKANNITLEFVNTYNGDKYYTISNSDGKYEITLEDGEYEVYADGGKYGKYAESGTQIALLTVDYGEVRKFDINLESMVEWSEERGRKKHKIKTATF